MYSLDAKAVEVRRGKDSTFRQGFVDVVGADEPAPLREEPTRRTADPARASGHEDGLAITGPRPIHHALSSLLRGILTRARFAPRQRRIARRRTDLSDEILHRAAPLRVPTSLGSSESAPMT